jgi:hypothetical protein
MKCKALTDLFKDYYKTNNNLFLTTIQELDSNCLWNKKHQSFELSLNYQISQDLKN